MAVKEIGQYAEWLIRRKALELVEKVVLEREDLEQELRCDLEHRLRRYVPGRSDLKLFIACVIDRKAKTILEHYWAAKRDPARNEVSLNSTVKGEDGEPEEVWQTLDGEANRAGLSSEELHRLSLDLASILSGLPVRLRTLCQHLMRGNVAQAARAMGLSRKTVYEDLKIIRARFEQAALRDYLTKRGTHRRSRR